MALGYTPYKTPNAIFLIGSDLTGKEGCGVTLPVQGGVDVAGGTTDTPYGIVTVGGPSEDGQYPGTVAASAVEFVDAIGCVAQALAGSYAIGAGEFVLFDSSLSDGSFAQTVDQPAAVGDWIWGIALTNAQPGEQFLMRFQPFVVQYVAPPPP